jgi:hypothetical protein
MDQKERHPHGKRTFLPITMDLVSGEIALMRRILLLVRSK